MADEKQEPMMSYIQFTKTGAEAMINLLDIARKHGTIIDAKHSIQFMDVITNNAQQLKEQEKKPVERTDDKETEEAEDTDADEV